MAKKIQKKQIEDGVFVETKATYSAPTQDNEFVQKKYVDEEVAKKADVSHTHSWADITNKPRISVTLADTAISRTYTIGLTGANGSSGKLIIPKAVSWNDVTDKPTFPTLPNWVTQTKPTYDWSEIQNKPALNYLPLTGGVLTPGDVVWYDGLKIAKSTAGWSTFLLGSDSNLDDKSWMIARNPQGQLMIQSTDNGLDTGLLLSNDFLKWKGSTFTVTKEGNVSAKKMFDAPVVKIHTPGVDYIALNSKGTKLNVKGDGDSRDGGVFKPVLASGYEIDGKTNNEVVLAGGGVTNLSELKNENIKVGGRNLITDSKNERYKEYKGTVEDYIYYGIVGGTLEKNTTYTLSLEYKSENLRNVEMFFINEGVSQVHGKNIPNTNGEWKRETLTFTTDANLSPKGSIRIDNNGSDTGNVTSKLWTRNVKLERGNIATDWTPAPEDIESKIPQYKTINDVHTFLDKNGSIHFGSGSNILNAPSSHFYEMVGFTHSDKNWGFIIAKNIDTEDKQLWVKQVVGGTYKKWFTLEDRSSERTINVTTSTFDITSNVVGQTAHIANDCVLNFNTMPELTTFAVRKVYDGGSVTFSGSLSPIYTGDTVLNGKKGSTAIIDYGLNNQIFIDIRNV